MIVGTFFRSHHGTRSPGPGTSPDPDASEAATEPATTEGSGSESDAGADMTPATGTDALSLALSERSALIDLCLYALDRAKSPGVVERLAEGFDDVGVVALRPDGERFDPARHEAAGTVPTDDPEIDGLVAETEILGFVDRDRMLRPPVVLVHQLRVAP